MYYNEKTAARMFNALIDSVDDGRDALRHAWIDKAGRMCACDGFRAYRINVPVAGVPDIDAEKTVDLDRLYPETIDENKALDLPSLADVRAMIEEDKRRKKQGENVIFDFSFGIAEDGGALPTVNLQYLADMLQLFPNARAYYSTPIDPIVFKDENGDALLLPIRMPGPVERRKAPAPVKRDKTPAVGLRTFCALYA